MTYSAVALVFPALMALAASYDMLTMTIPNRISLVLAAAFLVAAGLSGMPLQMFGMHLLAGLVVLVVAFVCFAMGWIGGGDAKLAAAAALWLGWAHVLDYAMLFSILGGALTLGLLFCRRFPLPALLCRTEWIARLHDRDTGIPYGIALALAALIVFPDTAWATLLG